MKLRIRLIRTNPPRRYCTKHVPARLAIPYWPMCSCLDEYIAVFNDINHLKG